MLCDYIAYLIMKIGVFSDISDGFFSRVGLADRCMLAVAVLAGRLNPDREAHAD